MQLTIFEEYENRWVEEHIHYFNERLEKESLPYDLIAINKAHTDSVVIYDRENKSSYYLSIFSRDIKYKSSAHHPDGFGTNFIIIDDRFLDRQSFLLTNRKRELISRSKLHLEKFIAEGWRVIE